jgi:hypothetical protein
MPLPQSLLTSTPMVMEASILEITLIQNTYNTYIMVVISTMTVPSILVKSTPVLS